MATSIGRKFLWGIPSVFVKQLPCAAIQKVNIEFVPDEFGKITIEGVVDGDWFEDEFIVEDSDG